MELLERKKCVIGNTEDLEHLYTFKKFPVFMGSMETDESSDLFADMSWVISKSSGLIQLSHLIPLDILYQSSHRAGSTGTLWSQHHMSFAKFISQHNPSTVFEIGGSHGILANEFHKIKDISWTILDPNPDPIPESKSNFITGFFDESYKYSSSFDTVVHSHLFEHMYDPDIFMKHLSDFIDNGKKLIFSIPHLEIMLERKYTNCINFEHTIFLTEPYVEYLLSKYGFRLLQKEYFMDDHSIFYAVIKDNSVQPEILPSGLYEKNKQLYQEYTTYHEKLISVLNYYISTYQQKVYVFGAHVFTQYLIGFGLNTRNIISILDNDKHKQGKRLYGTSLIVNSPEVLRTENCPIVILKAGVYNEEIQRDIMENINNTTIFWE